MMIAGFLNMPYKPGSVMDLPIYDVDLATETRNIVEEVKASYSPPEN